MVPKPTAAITIERVFLFHMVERYANPVASPARLSRVFVTAIVALARARTKPPPFAARGFFSMYVESADGRLDQLIR